MTHVELPEGFAAEEQKLPFFLAMEEFLARKGSGEYFFMWQVAPTVIFGRNQRIETEVNLDFCKKEGFRPTGARVAEVAYMPTATTLCSAT